MRRSMIFRLLSCAALSVGMNAVAWGEANRYHVLFIAIDDLRPELGCYGVKDAQSPHLDAFAETALRFDRHYVQSATCGASRYALLTGRSPARSGVTRNNQALYQGEAALNPRLLPGAQTLPERFRRSGYHTVCLGKISHTADGLVYGYDGQGDGRREVPHGWSELVTPYGPWDRGWGIFFAYPEGRHREDGLGHRDLMDFTVAEDEALPDGLLAQEAISQLKRLKERDQPFFLGLGFFKPHLPFVAPREDWEAFEGVPLEETMAPDRIDSPYWHKSNEFYKYAMPLTKDRPLSPADRQTARRAYLACVRYVDRQVGKVLRALETLELADRTIVVIWGDHGWHLGEQALWGKHTPFELAMRSVLMLRVPGLTEGGRATAALVETIDLYPTLASLCQPAFTSVHHPLDGRDLSPLLRGEAESVREAALSYWGRARSVRTPSHRLIVEGERRELYDLRGRSVEGQNLAENDAALLRTMEAYLEASD